MTNVYDWIRPGCFYQFRAPDSRVILRGTSGKYLYCSRAKWMVTGDYDCNGQVVLLLEINITPRTLEAMYTYEYAAKVLDERGQVLEITLAVLHWMYPVEDI